MKTFTLALAALLAPAAYADAPATRPATQPGQITPAELIRQMRQRQEEKQAKLLVAQIDLSSPLGEKPVGVSLFGSPGQDLRGVLQRLDAALNDDDVEAVLLTFYNGGQMNLAQAQEIGDKLDELDDAGKRTFVYADTYDTISYLVASRASDVVLMDGGELFMPGIAVEPTFYRGALDKLGVTPDYVQIGEYKGAEEPYTRTEPSPELAKEMESLVEAMYGQIVDGISEGRALNASTVKAAIDRAMTPAKRAVDEGLVDHLADADGLADLLEEELGQGEVRIDATYAAEDSGGFDPDNPFAIFELFRPREVDATRPSVAIVYAEGVISGGEGGGDLFTAGGVGSEYIRRAMRLAERDDEVKAVVIRIDSPGGSALASEAMYQAVERVAETKPVIISIGGMAASGGYYLAVAGDTIYADPAAVVGSIGVVGGKFVLDGLYDKLGVNTVTFSKGENAALFSGSEPWTDQQRRLVRRWMKSTYEQFVDRVEKGRGDAIEDVDEVARGRIFLAEDAKKLGMVDVLGGIDDAIAEAAERGGIGDDYDVVVLPNEAPNPLAGAGIGGLPIGQVLAALPPAAREAVAHAMTTARLLEERPVIVLAPFRLTVR